MDDDLEDDPVIRRRISEKIAERMQLQRTERVDMLSRKLLLSAREIFSGARDAAGDAEVAAAVVAAARVAVDQQERRETNVRRSRLRSSAVGHSMAVQAEMTQLLVTHRQSQDRDAKRKCARTIWRWAKHEQNDTRLLAEGAVDAAARLALEDDETTRKFAAAALRNLARRRLFWFHLLQPHVLQTFRELFNEEGFVQDILENTFDNIAITRNAAAQSSPGDVDQTRGGLPKITHAVPRDAALALVELTSFCEASDNKNDDVLLGGAEGGIILLWTTTTTTRLSRLQE